MNGALKVNWDQTPCMAMRESVSSLVRDLGGLMAQLACKSSSFLGNVREIILADSEGGLKAKQARISIQLQIKAFQKLVCTF